MKPSLRIRGRGPTVVVEYLVAATLLVTLAAYMLMGNFTRYVADDFGTVIAVRLRGFWAQQIAAYRLSDGHFVATALQTGAALLNPVVVQVLPGVLVAAWLGFATLGLRHLVPAAGRLGRLLIAAGIVYATIRITPSPFLTLYWMTASLAFIVPLFLAALLVWLITRPAASGRRGALVIACAGVVAFVAAGEAETYTVAQAVALTVAFGVALSRISVGWRRQRTAIAAAWIGAVSGLAVELLSPGNAIRSATISKLVVTPRPSLVGLPLFTFVKMLHFAHVMVDAHWHTMVALAILTGMLAVRSGAVSRSSARLALIAVALATLGLGAVLLSALAPSAREYGILPPLYDQVVPVYACVCAIATLGWVGGRCLRYFIQAQWPRMGSLARFRGAFVAGAVVLAGAAVMIGPIASLASLHRDLPALEAYANVKDAQAEAATAAHLGGVSSVVVPTIKDYKDLGVFSHTGLEELFDDPKYFVNKDEALYYGVVTIATPPGPTPEP